MPRRGHGADVDNGAHWPETARAGDSHSDPPESEPPMDASTNLTARLARAAGANAVEPADLAAAELGDDADDSRCTASVISGQRCRRPAADGQRLCPGHLAMGTKAPAMPRATLR